MRPGTEYNETDDLESGTTLSTYRLPPERVRALDIFGIVRFVSHTMLRNVTVPEQVIVQMAEQNRDWGYRRIQGALSNLGYKLARSTIADILQRHGIEPAPERSGKTTWKEFLTQHWELIVAA